MKKTIRPSSKSSGGNRAPTAELQAARAEVERLNAELADLQILYEAMIEHGEAVEDQLADSNDQLREVQRRLAGELADAARYLRSILPEPRRHDPATDWLLVPSTELGGDSFGYHDIGDDHFAIYLLDVCGHGVGAALLSASVVNVLRAGALNADFRDPSAVLAALNDAFPMEQNNNMFFTIWYGVYHRPKGRLTYAVGGHPPAIHLRNSGAGTVATLLAGTGGLVIGAMAGVEHASAEIGIEPGDRLVVVSDGTYEVADPVGRNMAFDDLVRFVREDETGFPAAVLGKVRAFRGEDALEDDFSLLHVRF